MSELYLKIARDIGEKDFSTSFDILKSNGFLPLSEYVEISELLELVRIISYFNSEVGFFLALNFASSFASDFSEFIFTSNLKEDSSLLPYADMCSAVAFISSDKKVYFSELKEVELIPRDTLAFKIFEMKDKRWVKENSYLQKDSVCFLSWLYVFLLPFVLGVVENSMGKSLSYANERIQGGKPIISYFPISDKITRIAEFVELVSNTVKILSHESESIRSKSDFTSLYRRVVFPLRYALREAQNMISEAIQIHGGYGYMKDFQLEKYFREIRTVASLCGLSNFRFEFEIG